MNELQEKGWEGRDGYRFLVENIEEYAIITLDSEGIIRSWNKGAQRLLKYSKKEAISKSGSVFFTQSDVEKGIDRKELKVAARKGRAEDERWHVRKDGSSFWGSGVVVPIKNGSKLTGFVKIFRDQTQKKEYELRKDEFVALASHELRTPLTILKLNVELLSYLLSKNKDPDAIEALQNIVEQSDRLTALVGDLLDISKIMSGKLAAHKEPHSLKKILQEVVKSHQSMALQNPVNLLQSDDASVLVDKDKMVQVLHNLITNAIKYSPKKGRVEIYARKKDRQITTYVRDHGIGISKKEQARIFERFYRIKNDRNTSPGLGIGLYVCFEIIKLHGGSIGVESPGEGLGTTFNFTLPVVG